MTRTTPSRRSRAAAPLLVALAALAASPPSVPAEPLAEGPAVEIPAGIPIALDGRPIAGEWDDAATVLPASSGLELKVKHARGTLLVAMRLSRGWEPTWRFVLFAVPGAEAGSWDAPGAVRIDVEPFDHNRPHALVQTRSKERPGWARTDDRVVFRTADLDDLATLEGAIPLELLGVTGTDAPPLRWLLGFLAPGREPSLRTFPAGLDIRASARGAPADLTTTARWARTVRLAQADGRGAFSKTDWDAWVAADHELTTRGEAAHRVMLGIEGAFSADASDERMKRDDGIEAALADFRWIAGRERWTHADARAYAVGLWQSNRAVEALGTLRTLASLDPGPETPEDLRRAATIARDAEQFDESAAFWERAAALIPEQFGAAYRRESERMRGWAADLGKERAARLADDAKGDLPLALCKTSKGEFLLRLLEDDCPESSKQFVHLAEETKGPDGQPYFDGMRFHRVVPAGAAQIGDPKSRGDGCATAGPGGSPWWIPAEKNARHRFFRGAVGWAMGIDRRVRSQFFVMTAPKLGLDERGFCCFGTVVAGMDVVDRLDLCDELVSVRILRKRDHPYVPTKNP